MARGGRAHGFGAAVTKDPIQSSAREPRRPLNDKRYALTKRALLLSAAVAALLCGRAAADTTITTKVTTPQNTDTEGNITIDSGGSVVITTTPPTAAAVTIESDNALVNNQGLISYNGVTSATAVKLTTGFSGEFESSGKVDLTGTGASKVGIVIAGVPNDLNSGTFTGLVPTGGTTPIAINLESGSITSLVGDDSIGISQLSGTTLAGDIDIAGTLTVAPTSSTGTSTSIGHVIAINLDGTVTGSLDVQTGGIVQATGEQAEGIQILGPMSGSLVNSGTIETAGTLRSNPANTNQPQAGSAILI